MPARRLTVLRAIDKLDRLGVEGVRQLLGAGRKDESGDFTKGAGLGRAADRSIDDHLQSHHIAEETSVDQEAQAQTDGAGYERYGTGKTRLRTGHIRFGTKARSHTLSPASKDRGTPRDLRIDSKPLGTTMGASASTPPSCAGSNITPAPSSRPS